MGNKDIAKIITIFIGRILVMFENARVGDKVFRIDGTEAEIIRRQRNAIILDVMCLKGVR